MSGSSATRICPSSSRRCARSTTPPSNAPRPADELRRAAKSSSTACASCSPQHRLVTLTGSGGCGKTRLAFQLATSLAEQHERRGALGRARADHRSLPGAVHRVGSRSGTTTTTGARCSRPSWNSSAISTSLAVLDNCEHLLERDRRVRRAAAARSCHACGSSPPAESHSGSPAKRPGGFPRSMPRLRAACSSSARRPTPGPGFDPDAAQRAAIARIAERLDRLPARHRAGGGAGPDDAADAHRRRARRPIPPADRRRSHRRCRGSRRSRHPWRGATTSSTTRNGRCSVDCRVFSRGFTLEAAEAVCADDLVDPYAVLELLTQLVDKSLVQVDSEHGRYDCSRPSGSTRGNDSSSRAKATAYVTGTWRSSSPGRGRRARRS